jgi:hypothetical protein
MTNDLEPFGTAERPPKLKRNQRWMPRSPKAMIRRWCRQNHLPLPSDKLAFVRLVRNHPSLLPKDLSPQEADLQKAYQELPLAIAEMERKTSLRERQKNLPTRGTPEIG